MELERWRTTDAIFSQALELAPEERRAFLDRACGGDEALRAEVESLLAADEKARSFLEFPLALTDDGGAEEPAVGSHFGPYRIERLIGRGGMGSVWLATRDDGQFERRVALKLLHHQGAGDPEALQRFRAERQILARLEHPAIARLYDGGETADGVPFLVMEYVEGLPLDIYCDRNRLTIEDRLRLFRRLLDAVAYAHQNLLVHRDIKPPNILVTAQGEPKLLDFGIAKQLVGAAGGAEPALTGLRPMTPGYASPEQVRGEAVTTASDVYALGVVLYELLCGRAPYRLQNGLPHELEAAILDQEPERPSQALGRADQHGPVLEKISAGRSARLRELRRRLMGDLDTLVLTALRKEPQRRYRSIVELAADIDNHLRSLPISARPDTVLYRTGKFVRRHSLGVALAGSVLLLIAALCGVLLHQRDQAERERDKSRAALAFLVNVFESADPNQKGVGSVTARDLLELGARRAAEELAGDPEIQAALMDAIGRASLGLGHIEEAKPLLEGALALRRQAAPISLDLASSLESVAWLKLYQSDYAAAEPLFHESISLRKRLLGNDSREVAATLNRLGNLLQERFQSSGDEQLERIESLHREALEIYRRLEGPAGTGVAESLQDLARIARSRGDLARAERLHRQALQIKRERLGGRHPDTLRSERALALTLIDQTQFAEAEELLRHALAAQREIFPRVHPDIAMTVNDLAMLRFRLGAYAEAEALYRDALAFHRAVFGEAHANTALVLSNLGGALQAQGTVEKLEEAERMQEKALAIQRSIYGERHIYVADSLGLLARVRSALGRHDEALQGARQSLDIKRELLQVGHPELAWPLRTLGIVLLNARRPSEAEPYLRQSLDLLRRTRAPGYFQTARVEVLLGACLAELGRHAEAEPLLEHGARVLETQLPDGHELVREAREKTAAFRKVRATQTR